MYINYGSHTSPNEVDAIAGTLTLRPTCLIPEAVYRTLEGAVADTPAGFHRAGLYIEVNEGDQSKARPGTRYLVPTGAWAVADQDGTIIHRGTAPVAT